MMFNFLCKRLASNQRSVSLLDSNTHLGRSLSRCFSSQISTNSCVFADKSENSDSDPQMSIADRKKPQPDLKESIFSKIEFLRSVEDSREYLSSNVNRNPGILAQGAEMEFSRETIRSKLNLGVNKLVWQPDVHLGNPAAFINNLEKRINPKFLAVRSLVPQGSIQGGIRLFSTAASSVSKEFEEVPQVGESEKKVTFRPLSPHLPVYKPQLASTMSIFNRICGAFLAGEVLFLYLLYVKAGTICLSNPSAYQFYFYSAKVIPISLQLSALALTYHVLYYPYKWICTK